MSAQVTAITFEVEAEVALGETVHVLGDAGLGCFEPTESIQLHTTPDDFPRWKTAQPLAFASGHPVKYRYAIFAGGELQLWEPISEDRTMVPRGAEMQVTDVFGRSDRDGVDDVEGVKREERQGLLKDEVLKLLKRFVVVASSLPVKIGTVQMHE